MDRKIWLGGLTTAACLAATVPSLAGSLERLTGYADLRFGLTVEEASALTGAAPSTAEGGALIETRETLVGRPAVRQLWFREGKLSRIVFRWTVEDRADPELCQAFFKQLADVVAGRYAKPVQGPTEITAGKEFTGGAFWAFPDGANIGLSASYAPRGSDGRACQAMLSFRAAPGREAGG
ncbi:MAG: hypothetical protein BroJett029_12710 [Alphaproteobacteria bacterium]|nr:MAG: hypothetical protein BroJett029_12710 [Alphaproteobacteria bacterium]